MALVRSCSFERVTTNRRTETVNTPDLVEVREEVTLRVVFEGPLDAGDLEYLARQIDHHAIDGSADVEFASEDGCDVVTVSFVSAHADEDMTTALRAVQ